MVRESAESVTVTAFNLSTIHNPSALTTREPVKTREENGRESVDLDHRS
jgi:hypothetical protein